MTKSFPKNTKRLSLLLILLALTGCSSLPSKKQGDDSQSENATSAPLSDQKPNSDTANSDNSLDTDTPVQENPVKQYESFEAETLYDIMVAEMAGKQNRLDVTLGNYMKQANKTRDPGIIARAMRIAKYMRAHQATLSAAELWLQVEPNNLEALETASVELMRAGDFSKALEYMDTILASEGNANFDFLVYHAKGIDNQQREYIINNLSQLLKKYPSNPQLWFTKALIEQQNQDFQSALDSTDTAIKLDEQYISAIIAKSRLLSQLDRNDEAIKILKKAIKAHPDHKRLRVIYAKTLIAAHDLEGAQKQFEILSEMYPNDSDLVLSLALISWETKQNDQARQFLQQLIDDNSKPDEAHNYLGQIAASEKNYDEAIKQYQQVRLGPYFTSAQIQIALITYELGHFDKALQILDDAIGKLPENAVQFYITKSDLLMREKKGQEALDILGKALEQYPDDSNLLYTRAMLAEELDNLDLLEKDLRTIISNDPNSALALNALGYTLADRTNRIEEAQMLIQKAYEIEPNDPAIIDSMGWIHYKLGEYDEALKYLRQAYQNFNDHEIVSHLGEVLWVSGRHDDAISVWEKGLQEHPDSDYLKETIRKFKAPIQIQ